MTRQQWLDEVRRRIGIDEGDRARMYRDSLGIETIGEGFNLERADARKALENCGVTDVDGVMNGSVALTPEQDARLFEYAFAPIESEARASLAPGVFDSMTDARRFVICDLVYNLGNAGWSEFVNSRTLLNQAQHAKNAGETEVAHNLFVQAAAHLEESAWYGQVGYRAMRDVAMIRTGEWVDPNGDGSN